MCYCLTVGKHFSNISQDFCNSSDKQTTPLPCSETQSLPVVNITDVSSVPAAAF